MCLRVCAAVVSFVQVIYVALIPFPVSGSRVPCARILMCARVRSQAHMSPVNRQREYSCDRAVRGDTACYDAGIDPEKKHNKEHLFNAIEVPELAGGLPIHRVRCWGCFTSPIVGSCFVCLDCRGLFFCQKCFFLEKEPKSHVKTHNMQVLLEPLEREHQVKWYAQVSSRPCSCSFADRIRGA